MAQELDGRRDVSSRNTKWAHKIAAYLAKNNFTPNLISIMSVVFSAIGGGILLFPEMNIDLSLYIALPFYILCILGRLLCNLFDGMVAIEGGKKSDNGDLYNDIPDRFSDALLIIPVGYLAGGCGVELAWLATILAVVTAYIRWLGASITQKHFFCGPMAKQHRMALLITASLVAMTVIHNGYYHYVFQTALVIMNIGLMVTIIRRVHLIAHAEKSKAK